jgi:hypothetical protein
VSYDLVIWCSVRSIRNPLALWRALYLGHRAELAAAGLTSLPPPAEPPPALSYDDAKALVGRLDRAHIVAAFRREYGDGGVEVVPHATETEVRSPHWQFTLADDAYYIHVCGAWRVATAEPALTKLRRAALRAGCSTYDIQSEALFEPTEL